MAERADERSRWNTLRALRMPDWAGCGGDTGHGEVVDLRHRPALDAEKRSGGRR